MKRALVLAALLAGGCGYLDAGDPVVVAHRGGAAYFPQNGAAAVRNAVAKRLPAIEFDLVLTKDRVPVLSHDPWLEQTLCTRKDGQPLPQPRAERIYVKDLTLFELRTGYVCGGVRDEDQPDAALVAEPMMTLEELLDEAKKVPEMLLALDVKYEPGLTEGPDVLAEEILKRWHDAALPNPWYVSANLPEALSAFESRTDVETVLAWPRFPPDSEDRQTRIALVEELKALTGFSTLAGLAREAGVDGLAITYQLADRHQIEAARAQGLTVRLWTPNTKALLEAFCTWPVDGLITDMPQEAPCL